MRILLDTHIFIWMDSEPQKLSASAAALCADTNNILVVSVASLWEMQIKSRIGKLPLRQPLPTIISQQQLTNQIEILPIAYNHVLALDALPMHHKDPFDRLLIAQANAENITLLTADATFSQYKVVLLN